MHEFSFLFLTFTNILPDISLLFVRVDAITRVLLRRVELRFQSIVQNFELEERIRLL